MSGFLFVVCRSMHMNIAPRPWSPRRNLCPLRHATAFSDKIIQISRTNFDLMSDRLPLLANAKIDFAWKEGRQISACCRQPAGYYLRAAHAICSARLTFKFLLFMLIWCGTRCGWMAPSEIICTALRQGRRNLTLIRSGWNGTRHSSFTMTHILLFFKNMFNSTIVYSKNFFYCLSFFSLMADLLHYKLHYIVTARPYNESREPWARAIGTKAI